MSARNSSSDRWAGVRVGSSEGEEEGCAVIGDDVGSPWAGVGLVLGEAVGLVVGRTVGLFIGAVAVGVAESSSAGFCVGRGENGSAVRLFVGCAEGSVVLGRAVVGYKNGAAVVGLAELGERAGRSG